MLKTSIRIQKYIPLENHSIDVQNGLGVRHRKTKFFGTPCECSLHSKDISCKKKYQTICLAKHSYNLYFIFCMYNIHTSFIYKTTILIVHFFVQIIVVTGDIWTNGLNSKLRTAFSFLEVSWLCSIKISSHSDVYYTCLYKIYTQNTYLKANSQLILLR